MRGGDGGTKQSEGQSDGKGSWGGGGGIGEVRGGDGGTKQSEGQSDGKGSWGGGGGGDWGGERG